MRRKENYTQYIGVAFGFTLAILIIFQIYFWREPARLRADEEADRLASETAGRDLFAENCTSCHGDNGEGGAGPALKSRQFLATTSDELLFNLARTGIPGTLMPAWGQAFGGPFTDEQVVQLVAFIRSWEATAPEIKPVAAAPDPVSGATIYQQTCFICHGANGQGSDRAPALNDPARLQKLDDGWYRSTIAHGRPAKGMPTWGTVLSPAQINDVVALIASWRAGETITANIPLATLVTNALFAMQQFDQPDVIFFLNAAQAVADSDQAPEIQAIVDLVEGNHLFDAQSRLTALLPPAEMGKALFINNCAPCHGDDGTGGLGPNLHTNSFVQSMTDEDLVDFVLAGRQGTAMDGFEGILAPDDLINVAALLRTWQE
ncbi:MAG: c-type cytochrome [Anaerolineae bacterium]